MRTEYEHDRRRLCRGEIDATQIVAMERGVLFQDKSNAEFVKIDRDATWRR